ncbi:hypothetical protein SAMN05444483_101332 [Salegentibacter echinorum]|uniref:Uncharacterized protein n=1 Tax=Salegentibacter echinorum TaxID=1073325 RepID=A0A1M5C4M7_SALEC|nr:hypothetical protein SAMN05444483_101332 [Salegentibacter echinorum]
MHFKTYVKIKNHKYAQPKKSKHNWCIVMTLDFKNIFCDSKTKHR